MIVSKEIEFDAGHRVPNHKSKCHNLHGHRYKVEVGVDDKVVTSLGASDQGMVIDFSDLKHTMMEQIDKPFDHACLLFKDDPLLLLLIGSAVQSGELDQIKDFDYVTYPIKLIGIEKFVVTSFIPTAENIARCIFVEMMSALETVKINLSYVKIWETPSSSATYTIQNYVKDTVG